MSGEFNDHEAENHFVTPPEWLPILESLGPYEAGYASGILAVHAVYETKPLEELPTPEWLDNRLGPLVSHMKEQTLTPIGTVFYQTVGPGSFIGAPGSRNCLIVFRNTEDQPQKAIVIPEAMRIFPSLSSGPSVVLETDHSLLIHISALSAHKRAKKLGDLATLIAYGFQRFPDAHVSFPTFGTRASYLLMLRS